MRVTNGWGRKAALLLILALVLIAVPGCQSGQASREVASQEDYEKLPEDQKESELDKALAETRRQNKEYSDIEQDGGVIAVGLNAADIPGYFRPPNDHFTEDELGAIYDTARAWIKSKGIEITKEKDQTIQECYDPRMNQIYRDKDKGIANGYENKDIFVMEYETNETDVYSYLLLVRDKTGKWKVLRDGTSYKE